MFISYAQNFEDVLLNRVFKNQESGFYIDVGANHPIYDSVTKAFYHKNWHGINIEPVTKYFKLLEDDRANDINLNIALGEEEKELIFYDVEDTGLSTFDAEMADKFFNEGKFSVNKYTVKMTTLAHICQEYVKGDIDFLKIDVEGWEEKVLWGNNWEKFRPKIIIIEATIPNSPERKESNIPDFLASNNYHHIYFDGLNDFYLADKYKQYQDFFRTPVNIFDHFICFRELDNQQHIKNLEKIVTIKDNQNKDIELEINHLQEILINQQKQIDEEKKEINKLYFYINNSDKIIDKQNEDIKELNSYIRHLEDNSNQQNKDIEKLNSYIRHLETTISEKNQYIEKLEFYLHELESSIEILNNDKKNSKGFSLYT